MPVKEGYPVRHKFPHGEKKEMRKRVFLSDTFIGKRRIENMQMIW
jgi:hypothetical protein